MMRPKVKICGVTCAEDARLAVDLGADYLGLNFHPPSPRYVDPERGREIAAETRSAAAARVGLVGVFVNRPSPEIEEIADRVGLDLVQFHGDEGPQEIAPFRRRALKALRVDGRLDATAASGWQDVWGLLLDARHPELYGGSGESWDLASLGRAADLHPRVFIAGGLGPGNVRAALAARPWGLDLCSGVEARPGRKDRRLMERLFEEIDHGASPPAA